MIPSFKALPKMTPWTYLPLTIQNHSKALVVFSMVCILLLFWKDIIRDALPAVPKLPDMPNLPAMPSIDSFHKKKKPGSLDSIANRTLGFQEIFALSLPDRKDRRLPLVRAANATNITIAILDAVRDEQIPQENIPEGWAVNGHEPKYGELGCLRSHVMTWEKMIEKNITSALIMESDADWDMRIHDILPGVAVGAKEIADFSLPYPAHPRDLKPIPEVNPYGDNWDVLWIGHCGSKPSDGTGRIYYYDDPTVPPKSKEFTFAGNPRDEQHPPGTRLVFEQELTICTSAYAISLQGAIKFRKFLERSNLNIDIRMEDLCKNEPSLMCLGVWPQVITAAPSQSNIKHPEGEKAPGSTDEMDNGVTPGPALQFSARRNADLASKGFGQDKWFKEW